MSRINPIKVINDINGKPFVRYFVNDYNLPLVFCYDKKQNLKLRERGYTEGIISNCYYCFSNFFENNEAVIKYENGKYKFAFSERECVIGKAFSFEFLLGSIL
jgi:hypothetical protein